MDRAEVHTLKVVFRALEAAGTDGLRFVESLDVAHGEERRALIAQIRQRLDHICQVGLSCVDALKNTEEIE